jgi:nucleolar protein 12
MSLLGSLFGDSSKKSDSNPLSNAFEASSALPDKPQHKAVARKKKRKKPKPEEEKKEADDDDEKTKKKRKRKDGEEGETAAADDSNKEETTPAPDDDKKEEANERTIFVGNLPLDTTRKSLAAIFKDVGKVASTRLRSVATLGTKVAQKHAGNQGLVKKICANTQKVDAEARTTAQGYVVFVEKESVEAALALNNTKHEGKILRVDRSVPTVDASRSVFVGNLPYQADETSLRQHCMHTCSLSKSTEIENVRIIRDKETQQCKGFGYILFSTKEPVTTALQRLNDSVYKRRNLRVSVCGKRYKNRRGVPTEAQKARKDKKMEDVAGAMQRILTKEAIEHKNNKRKRGGASGDGGPKKTAENPHGLSRRQASEQKLEKRHKKLQKRATKGMGKLKQRG